MMLGESTCAVQVVASQLIRDQADAKTRYKLVAVSVPVRQVNIDIANSLIGELVLFPGFQTLMSM